IRRQLHHYAVLWENTDVVMTHLAGNVSKNLVPIIELDTEHFVWQRLDNATLYSNCAILSQHLYLSGSRFRLILSFLNVYYLMQLTRDCTCAYTIVIAYALSSCFPNMQSYLSRWSTSSQHARPETRVSSCVSSPSRDCHSDKRITLE